MFLCLMVIPLLYGFSSDGSFPKPLSAKEEKKYLEQYQNGTEAEQKEAKEGKPATTGLGLISGAKWLWFWDALPEVSAGP